jgi:GTP-binding protein
MPAIAIIGRQNVGKSSLFNVLLGHRKSIIYNQPGVTRDLITEKVPWGEGTWTLTDFPGFESEKKIKDDALTLAAIRAAEKQLEKFNLLIFVVKRGGLTTYEQDLANRLRRSKKPVWLVVNFIDDPQLEAEASEFYQLGFPELFFVSALNHRNIGELRERIQAQFKTNKKADISRTEDGDAEEIVVADGITPDLKLAILGKPNAGKSTLFNTLTGKDRALISPVAGTTRDSINEFFHFEGKLIEVVDTAGLRRQRNVVEDVESISVKRAREALEACEVVFLVMDYNESMDKQNKTLFALIADAGKPLIALINKYDIFREDNDLKAEVAMEIEKSQKAFWKFPWYFISAETGENCIKALTKAFELRRQVIEKIGTPKLNTILKELAKSHVLANQNIKLKYITQGNPLNRFILFTNKPVTMPVRRHLNNELRKRLDMTEVPILLQVRTEERKPKK